MHTKSEGAVTLAEQVQRIKEMEQALNAWSVLADEGEGLLGRMEEALPQLERLVRYYSSEQWWVDLSACEGGLLPEDLACGVLSEDAVFDVLTSLYSLVEQVKTMNLKIGRIP